MGFKNDFFLGALRFFPRKIIFIRFFVHFRYFVNMDENSQFSIFDFSQELIRESYSPVFFYVISGDERLVFTFQPGKSHNSQLVDTLSLYTLQDILEI